MRPETEEEAGKLLHPWLEIHPLLPAVLLLGFLFGLVFTLGMSDTTETTLLSFFFFFKQS